MNMQITRQIESRERLSRKEGRKEGRTERLPLRQRESPSPKQKERNCKLGGSDEWVRRISYYYIVLHARSGRREGDILTHFHGWKEREREREGERESWRSILHLHFQLPTLQKDKIAYLRI